ncbi:MAG: hypothetical protein H6709_18245 [Kofleriaceae bacterium]|nr:hypothetical protein [Kofleriaceae bacterium]MCB9574027.1 hypothetical protein [Kofleriaceae bacterium]
MRTPLLILLLGVAACQGGDGKPAATGTGTAATTPAAGGGGGGAAPLDPSTANLPLQVRGAAERVREAVAGLRAGTADPARGCGVVQATRDSSSVAGSSPELDAVLAEGETLCGRDVWLRAAGQQLDRADAGDRRGCTAGQAALDRVDPAHRADAETEAVAARLRASCPTP